MFTFNNLLSTLGVLNYKNNTKNSKLISDNYYTPPSPGEIRESIKNLSRCPKCHFLIFDNYWADEIEASNLRPCPTCGYK